MANTGVAPGVSGTNAGVVGGWRALLHDLGTTLFIFGAAIAVWFFAAFAGIMVILVAGVAAALGLEPEHVPLAWLPVVAVLALTAWTVKNLSWRLWTPGAGMEPLGREADRHRKVLLTILVTLLPLTSLVCLLGVFVSITAVLVSEGILDVAEPISDWMLVPDSLAYYVWHLLEAIPVLEVPSTLGWEAPMSLTGYDGGATLLMFKVLILVPLLQIVAALIAAWLPRD